MSNGKTPCHIPKQKISAAITQKPDIPQPSHRSFRGAIVSSRTVSFPGPAFRHRMEITPRRLFLPHRTGFRISGLAGLKKNHRIFAECRGGRRKKAIPGKLFIQRIFQFVFRKCRPQTVFRVRFEKSLENHRLHQLPEKNQRFLQVIYWYICFIATAGRFFYLRSSAKRKMVLARAAPYCRNSAFVTVFSRKFANGISMLTPRRINGREPQAVVRLSPTPPIPLAS